MYNNLCSGAEHSTHITSSEIRLTSVLACVYHTICNASRFLIRNGKELQGAVRLMQPALATSGEEPKIGVDHGAHGAPSASTSTVLVELWNRLVDHSKFIQQGWHPATDILSQACSST